MRKVLAVSSVSVQHKQLVYKELKTIFKKTKITLDTLLQGQLNDAHLQLPMFPNYPYITLTIPNYQTHRQYLEKAYKNNVLFSKFILLISEGNTYEQLISNRNEQLLIQNCRNWNDQVHCDFECSVPLLPSLDEQMKKIEDVLGRMDIRGQINHVAPQKKLLLVEHHTQIETEYEEVFGGQTGRGIIIQDNIIGGEMMEIEEAKEMSEATADEADDDVDDRYCDDRKDNKYCQQPQQRVIPGLSHLRKLFFGLVLRKNGGIRRKRVGYAVEGNDAMCHFLDDELSLDYVPSQKAVVRAFDTAAWQSVRSLLNKSLQTTKLKQNNEFKSPYLKKANPCDCEASTSNK